MNAIIVTGGKQYKVSEGDVIYIEKLDNEAGDTVKFEQVLAIIDGEKATFGAPVVEGASVEAKIVKNGKGKKIRIFKYNPKKGYRKRQGHRQGSRITGFDVQGHSGYAEAGADIVCAAITSAVRLVETTVNDVLGLAASVKVRESDASISLRLPGSLGQTAESTCQALLTGMMVYFAQLHDEYPEHIEVLEDE